MLAVGIDADAASMRRAAGRASRDRLGNALFVVAAAEDLPAELHGVADHVSIVFPWGSLLRGLVTGSPAVLGSVAPVLRPGGDLLAMWSIADRDRGGVTPPNPDDLAFAAAGHGLIVFEHRRASQIEIDATGSSWAKRLAAGRSREVTLFRARRC